MESKTALVTAATDGIGLTLAQELAARGYAVLTAGKNFDAVELARSVGRDALQIDLLVNATTDFVLTSTLTEALLAAFGRNTRVVNLMPSEAEDSDTRLRSWTSALAARLESCGIPVHAVTAAELVRTVLNPPSGKPAEA